MYNSHACELDMEKGNLDFLSPANDVKSPYQTTVACLKVRGLKDIKPEQADQVILAESLPFNKTTFITERIGRLLMFDTGSTVKIMSMRHLMK